jgi:hypothetical protein
MLGVSKGYSFVVSLNSDLRPLVGILNRELASRGAELVRKEELPEIDEMLQEVLVSPSSGITNCPHCHGYVSIDLDGELTCLNCARPAVPRKGLDDVVEKIAQMLVAAREEEPGERPGPAQSRRTLSPRRSR